jgi:hypothetical protein
MIFATVLLICHYMSLLVGFPESSGGRIGFPLSISFHHDTPCSLITRGMKIGPMVAAVQGHSLDMIFVIMVSDRSVPTPDKDVCPHYSLLCYPVQVEDL